MPFRNDRQRADVCRLLLEQLNMQSLWSAADIGRNGPTDTAVEMLHKLNESGFSRLSSGERIWLRVVFDFWDGTGHASIHELINRLDRPLVDMVGKLVSAAAQPNSDAVDKWLKEWKTE